MAGAIQFHSLTPTKKDLTFEEWMQVIKSKPLVCMSSDDFGDNKKLFEKFCSYCNCCTYDQKEEADTLFETVGSIKIKSMPKK